MKNTSGVSVGAEGQSNLPNESVPSSDQGEKKWGLQILIEKYRARWKETMPDKGKETEQSFLHGQHWEVGEILAELLKIAGAHNASLSTSPDAVHSKPHNETGLLPCPFCGSDAQWGIDGHGGECVECCNPMCATSSMLVYPLKEGARPKLLELWNRRVPQIHESNEVAALQEAREALKEARRWINPNVDYDGDDLNEKEILAIITVALARIVPLTSSLSTKPNTTSVPPLGASSASEGAATLQGEST